MARNFDHLKEDLREIYENQVELRSFLDNNHTKNQSQIDSQSQSQS